MQIKPIRKVVLPCLLSLPLSLLSLAQQATPSPNSDSTGQTQQPAAQDQTAPAGQQTPADKNDKKSEKDKAAQQGKSGTGKVEGTSNDRLFYTLPNFLTLEKGGQLPPLSAKDKFKVVALGSFDYVEFPWWGILSAINQTDNSEPAYGQGWGAYAKRYGTTAGDSLIENFMVGAVFPSVLHQDPRFYQSGKGGFFRRTGYSVSRIFVTRGDSGHTQFNFSEVFGAATAAAISTYTYHPTSTYTRTPTNPHLFVGSDRTLSNTINVYGTQLTLDTITIVVKEFWPDIHRKISHKHKPQPAQ